MPVGVEGAVGVPVGTGVPVSSGGVVGGGVGSVVSVGSGVGVGVGVGVPVSDGVALGAGAGVDVGDVQGDEQSSAGDAAIPTNPVASRRVHIVATSRILRRLRARLSTVLAVGFTPEFLMRSMSHRDGRERPPIRVLHRCRPATTQTERSPTVRCHGVVELRRRWDDRHMVEAILWGIIGTVGIVGAILGLAAAFQLGRTPYRSK